MPQLRPVHASSIPHGTVSHTTRYPTQDHRTPLLSISADATGAARNESGHLELGRVQRPKTAILSAFRRSPSQVPHIRHAHATRGRPVTRGRRRARDRALVVRKSRACAALLSPVAAAQRLRKLPRRSMETFSARTLASLARRTRVGKRKGLLQRLELRRVGDEHHRDVRICVRVLDASGAW